MIDKLKEHSDKIPSPACDDMMEMLNHVWEKTLQNVDGELAFKHAFDASKDHLTSPKLIELVGKDLIAFRAYLLKQSFPQISMILKS